jgi:branched-chain amino acid transport system substrate-binding protein
MKLIHGLAITAIGLVGLTACGNSSSGGSTANKGTIKIGVDLPESGNETSNGIPTLNGVKFAVQEAGSVKGFTLVVENKDDAVNGVHDAQKGVQNVRDLIADTAVLSMVGPFNSSVARAEIPVTNQVHLAQISPANTNQCLTKPIYIPTSLGVPKDISCTDAGLPTPEALRPSSPNNYFRVATTDDLQGPAMADYAYDTLKLKNIAVASDNQVYGKGISDTFSQEFKHKGGSIAKRQDFDTASTNDFKPFFTSAKQANADGIYFGGTDATKVCVARSQQKGILDVPFMGGDGIVTSQCLKDSADNAANMYGTTATADATKVPASKAIIDNFKKAFSSKDDFGAYTMPAYDAAKIEIAAIGRAIDGNGGNMPTRLQVLNEIAKTKDYTGALGTYSFTAAGDTTAHILTIYKTTGTPLDWVSVDVVTPNIKV